eukprot:CAMPEP_0184022248 /NCGR_PEP_ID=MMETSP0954-20121128/10487_1 /TAXON_ID=627963 /ORGANISM="Aplanochytrium sp, Strain PBS07" /LENGTH=591 /DNA_ID=CAMNT_0026304575 /DNA_START=159 /DNA_END=1931 /DNA_ORIENTATION=+
MDTSLLDEEKSFVAKSGNSRVEKELFGLDKRLIRAVQALGFKCATKVQAESIPLALKGKDLLVRARTGSGKTLAYALPTLQKILTAKESLKVKSKAAKACIRAVILVPSRELVTQAENQLTDLILYCKDCIKIVALAAESREIQEGWLTNYPDVVISTPGRLSELLKKMPKTFIESLRPSVETFVVDEADLIFSYGYADDVNNIVSHLPKTCQSFLMSATLDNEVTALKKLILHNPAVIKLEEGVTDGKLSQWYVGVGKDDKDLLLFALLRLKLITGKILFFVNTVDRCYRLKLLLEQYHIQSAVLNAELPLNSRLHILEQFNNGFFNHLIATDDSLDVKAEPENEDNDGDSEEESAKEPKNKKKRKNKYRDDEFGVARGIDFRGVQTVVNVDFPKSVESYVHRIGRTARGGESGTALSIVNLDDEGQLEILKEIQNEQPKKNDPNAARTSEDGNESNLVPQPSKLALDVKEIEPFRYRVEDVRRAVTRNAIRDARLKEIKQEMLNSSRLQAHFEDNPTDLNLLAHDTHLRPNKLQKSLANIPEYLLPAGMFGARQKKLLDSSSNGKVKRSISGRNLWKMKHGKGKYKGKK